MAEGNAETATTRLGAGDGLLEGMRVGAVDQAAAEATRCRVVDTAERLFRQFGYLKTTVGDIAAELGMSSANIYRFFASKAAITEAVLQKVTGEVIAEAEAIAADPALGAEEKLRRVVRACNRAICDRCLADSRMHAMVHAAIDGNWHVIRRHKAALREVTTGIIAEGVRSGEFDVADPGHAAFCFQHAMMSSLHPVIVEHRLREGEDIEATIEPMLAFALRALGAARRATDP
ncbi:MAG TPA: TetR family transcriptional regulator [Amaricoccus sp.]|nr:TetR family transcriptional regulator [Amaricoccus sp.]